VRDICAAYAACLTASDAVLPPGTILNLASGSPRRIGDVLNDLCRLAGLTPAIESDAGLLRPSDIPRACGDSSLARRLLGWEPKIAWEQTLTDVLADGRGRVS
jgi:GDP-4-dehydro-6-deoxy-D-mannose reductase